MDRQAITDQATTDQQAGIPLTRGRKRYETVAEQSHYMNMWLESMRTNGVPAQFAR